MVDSVEYHVLLSGAELGVSLDDLVDGVHQVLLGDGLPSGADREHAALGAHRTNICAGRVWAHPRNKLKSDVLVKSHSLRVNLEDLYTTLEVGEAELDFSVETSRSGQCRVESIGSISSHEHFDIAS